MYPMNYFRQYSCCSLNQITTLSIRIKTKQEINKDEITNDIIKYLDNIYNDIKIKDPLILSKKLFELQDFKTLDEIKNYINNLILQGADINYFNVEDYIGIDFYKKYKNLLNQKLINDIYFSCGYGVCGLKKIELDYNTLNDITKYKDPKDIKYVKKMYKLLEDKTLYKQDYKDIKYQKYIKYITKIYKSLKHKSSIRPEDIDVFNCNIKIYYRLLDYICVLKDNFNKDFSYKELCIFLYSLNYNFMNDYDEFLLFKEIKYKNVDVLNYIREEYLEKIKDFNPEVYLINHIIENNNDLVKDPLMIDLNSKGRFELYYKSWLLNYDYPKELFNFTPITKSFNFKIENSMITGSILSKLNFISIDFNRNFDCKKYYFSYYINKQKYFLFDNIENPKLKDIKVNNVISKYILSYISEFIIDELKLNNINYKINNRYGSYFKETDNFDNLIYENMDDTYDKYMIDEYILEDYLIIDNKTLLKMYYKFS